MRNFKVTTQCRESAHALPLFVFHQGKSHDLTRDTKERFFLFMSDCGVAKAKARHSFFLCRECDVQVTGAEKEGGYDEQRKNIKEGS